MSCCIKAIQCYKKILQISIPNFMVPKKIVLTGVKRKWKH